MILIYGKGKVGQGLVKFCEHREYKYEICDDTSKPEEYSKYTHIIPSPGIPETHEIYAQKKAISELDFLVNEIPDGFTVCSITGTDGKSTTAWILYQILRQEFATKKPVYLAGNFDKPLASVLVDIEKNNETSGYIVLEVSSFMAYGMKFFMSDYSILTNLQPDHQDWHSGVDSYYEAKMNLIYNTTQAVVAPYSVFEQISEFETLAEKTVLLNEPDGKDRVEENDIIISGRKKYQMSGTRFSGKYNASNILAATKITNLMGICSKRTKKYLENIEPLEHRIQKVSDMHNRVWVDDSKSTSAQSQRAGLAAFAGRDIILIAGGKDKGDMFQNMESSWQDVRVMILLGEMAELLDSQARSAGISTIHVDSMQKAVQEAYSASEKDSVILLSPGCSSLDMFDSYADRAGQFITSISCLPE